MSKSITKQPIYYESSIETEVMEIACRVLLTDVFDEPINSVAVIYIVIFWRLDLNRAPSPYAAIVSIRRCLEIRTEIDASVFLAITS